MGTSTMDSKEYTLSISLGDHLEYGKGMGALNTSEALADALKLWQERYRVSKLYWRVEKADYQNGRYVHKYGERNYWRALQELADRRFDAAQAAIKAAHSLGMSLYIYTTIIDEGDDPPSSWRTHFATAHPEYQVVDRTQKNHHPGVLCLAYPEVQEYQLGWIKELMDVYPADGVFISLRAHVWPAAHADQFGFNEPVVEEFKRRYGVNILWDDFDVEAWRALRGEYLTQILRRIKDMLRPMGRKLAIGIPRCARLGPPFGNMLLDWHTWVQAGIVDDLRIGVVSGRWLHSDKPAGYGYVGSDEDCIGVKSLLEDVDITFGPVCKAHGCPLYITQSNFQLVSPEMQAGLLESPYLTGITLNSGRLPETDYTTGLLEKRKDLQTSGELQLQTPNDAA